MTRILGWVALVVVFGLGSPPADALCVCDTFGSCSSAVACDGKSPGDSCTPPRNSTCKIVAGNGNGLSCCCGCSRGAGPISCLYTPVADQLALLSDAVCAAAATSPAPLGQAACQCPDPKLDKQTDKVVKGAGNDLRKADGQCKKGKSAKKRAKSGRKKVAGLKKRIKKAQDRDDITPECATALNGLVDTFLKDIDDAGQGGGTGGATTTTTTTTTTMPGPAGPTCTPTFANVPGFPNERDFTIVCQGGNDVLTGFDVDLVPPFQITNHIPPAGFTCPFTPPNATLSCNGNFAFGDTITGGRIETNPGPGTPGFGATLSVHTQGGADQLGPFPFTGP